MKVRFTKRVGDMNFEIEEEAKDEKALFDVVEFWSSLPSEHPSGATDLRFAHRQAKNSEQKTINFYEIVCVSKNERFCFGQRAEGGGLFPKGWQEVYRGEGGDHHEGEHDQEPPRQHTRPQSVERRPTQTGSGNIDAEIRDQFQRLGVANVGQEKAAVMKALNSKVGILVAELNAPEKADLLNWLQGQEVRRAA